MSQYCINTTDVRKMLKDAIKESPQGTSPYVAKAVIRKLDEYEAAMRQEERNAVLEDPAWLCTPVDEESEVYDEELYSDEPFINKAVQMEQDELWEGITLSFGK